MHCLVVLSESTSCDTVAMIEAAFAAKLTWKVAENSGIGNSSGSIISDSFRLLEVAFKFEAVINWEGHSCWCSSLKLSSTVVEMLEGRIDEEDCKRKITQNTDHGKLSTHPIPRI